MGKKVGPRDVAAFVELQDEGYKPSEIAGETGWNVNTIRHHLKKYRAENPDPATGDPTDTPDPGYSDDDDSDDGESPPTTTASADTSIFSDDGDLFSGGEPGPRPVHELLDGVLDRMGVTADKRKSMVDMVRTTPQYADARGLFSFLIDMNVNGHKARLVVEQVFGMQAYDSHSPQPFTGPQNFNMPSPVQHMNMPPGQPNFNFPQAQPQPQWMQDSQGRWIQVHVHNPMQPQQTQQGLSPAEVERMMAEGREKERQDRELDNRFASIDDKFSKLASIIQNQPSSDDGYVEEIVPERNPDGTVMKDPDTGEIIRKKITRPVSQRSGESAMMEKMFDKMLDDRRGGDDPRLEAQKEENQKLVAELRDEKLRKEQAEHITALREQIAAEREETRNLLRGVAAELGGGDHTSDEVRIGLAKIGSQTDVVRDVATHVHATTDKLLDIGKELIKKPPPKGRDEVDQWTTEELAELQ